MRNPFQRFSRDDAPVNTRGVKWQEECAAITRRKAKQKRRSALRRRVLIVTTILMPASVGLGGWWMVESGEVTRASDAVVWWGYDMTRRLGFEVQQVRVEGLQTLPAPMVAKAAGIMPGEPIFKISVQEAQARIEALPEIRSARVERALPDMVRLIVQEREPYALWQHDGKQLWMDRDGTLLHNQTQAAHEGDMVLVGEDVPHHAGAFLAMIDQTPDLRDKVSAAQRIGGRRWNVRLTNGMVIKLPQQGQETAWQKLAELVTQQQLLERAVTVIDLRLEDRAIVTLDEADGKPAATGFNLALGAKRI